MRHLSWPNTREWAVIAAVMLAVAVVLALAFVRDGGTETCYERGAVVICLPDDQVPPPNSEWNACRLSGFASPTPWSGAGPSPTLEFPPFPEGDYPLCPTDTPEGFEFY